MFHVKQAGASTWEDAFHVKQTRPRGPTPGVAGGTILGLLPSVAGIGGRRRMRSLANAEGREDLAEHVLDADGADDPPERLAGEAEIFGDEFRRDALDQRPVEGR